MMYPILFPTGQWGWDPMAHHNSQFSTSSRNRITQLQYYCYRLAFRYSEFSAIHRSGKLFQQYIVDAFVKTEAGRLAFIASYQSQLRVECYQDLLDHVHLPAAALNAAIGRIVTPPSSYVGSLSNMQEGYQDAIAIDLPR